MNIYEKLYMYQCALYNTIDIYLNTDILNT